MGFFSRNSSHQSQHHLPATKVEDHQVVWNCWKTGSLVAAGVFVVVLATVSITMVVEGSSAVDSQRVTSLEMKVIALEERYRDIEEQSRSYIDEQLAIIVDQVCLYIGDRR